MPIDIKKDIKPLLQPDWTRMDGSQPFFQQASGSLLDRYSITVITEATTTDGSNQVLDSIKTAAVPTGFTNILEFYEKLNDPTDSKSFAAFAEDWYISERPRSKIKVLVSIPSGIVDDLPEAPAPTTLPIPWAEIYFNTADFQEKVDGIVTLLKKYNANIKKFRGKVHGLELVEEIENFANSIIAVSGLMQANGYTYGSDRSDLLIFGIDSDYKFLYGQINDDSGCGFQTLYKDFPKFQKTSVATNKRTVNFLRKLDDLYQIHFKNENIPMQTFFDAFVLNPPTFDFSEIPRQSIDDETTPVDAKQKIGEDNSNPQKTTLELESFVAWNSSPEQRANAQEVLDTTANFIGDTMMNGLQTVTDSITLGTGFMTRNPGNYLSDGIFKRLLNKIPLQQLIQAALECLGFPGFEFLNMAKGFLNQANSFLDNIAALLNKQIPTIQIPDNFPIADYMKDLGVKILWGILEAVVGVLIQMLIELLMQLLDACNECALANEAEGRSRFDGMNFGGMNIGDSLLKGLVVGTVGEIGSTMMRESGANQIETELLGETKRWAKDPLKGPYLDLTGDPVQISEGMTPEEMEEKVKNAKTEVVEYLNVSSEVLTPGEMGNMMLGCGSGTEALDAVTNLLENFPNLKWAICPDGECSHNVTRKLWEDLGKILGANSVLAAVKEVTDAMPESIKCLCDADDIALRKQLLENKGLSNDQITDQITKSMDRRKQRLEDLAKMLEKGNPLEGMVPSIYCTIVYHDENNNEVPSEKVMPHPADSKAFLSKETGEPVTRQIKQGLLDKDHPTLIHMMNKVLDTIYDSIAMAFNENLDGFIPTLTKETYTTRPIPRTQTVVYSDGTSELVLNPEWTKLVKDSQLNYSYGALPANASVPGTNLIRDFGEEGGFIGIGGSMAENVTNGVYGEPGDPDHGDPLLDWGDGVLTIRERMAAGQMQTGQTQPTAEQEAAWELAMTASSFYVTKGGRKRPLEYGTQEEQDATPWKGRMADYTRLYGYSPIPVNLKEKGPTKFAPGLQEAYEKMCKDTSLFSISDSETRQVYGGFAAYHLYNFKIDQNLFEAAQIGDVAAAVLGANNAAASAPVPTPPTGIDSADFTQGMNLITEAFRNLMESTYDITYTIPFGAAAQTHFGEEAYATTIVLTPPPVAGSVGKPPFILYQKVEKEELSEPIKEALIRNVVGERLAYHWSRPEIRQEQEWVTWTGEALTTGPEVWRQNQHLSDSRTICRAVGQSDCTHGLPAKFVRDGVLYGIVGLADLHNFKQYLKDHDYYDKLWREMYCKFTRMIARSPFMDLKTLNTLDLIPMNKMGQDPNCDPDASLLDFEIIKQRIKDEYGLIQCIESCFPNVDGLGTNKDKPFEKANLGGAVLLTVRTYVLEVLLRSIFVFYYFRFSDPESIDTLLISYISALLQKDVAEKQFINEFKIEALELYNRNAENIGRPETDDLEVVLRYFIRYQIFGVSNRLSKTVGSIGDISLDSYLLDDQSPTNPAWIPGYNVPEDINGYRGRSNGEVITLKTDGPSGGGSVVEDPVPLDRVMALVGDGNLSRQTIQKFDWNQPVSIPHNLPVGVLLRSYFSKDPNNSNTSVHRPKDIWSMEAPREYDWNRASDTRYLTTEWGWITGNESLSPSKQSYPVAATGIWFGEREEAIFRASGLLGTTTDPWAFTYTWNGTQSPRAHPENPNIPDYRDPNNTWDAAGQLLTGDYIAYDYGVSHQEQLAMELLLPMLAAGLASPHYTMQSGLPHPAIIRNMNTLETERIIEFIAPNTKNCAAGDANCYYYPGKVLKDLTKNWGGGTMSHTWAYDEMADRIHRPSHTFKTNQVWDRRTWNWTGEEIPRWIKEGWGVPISTDGGWVPTPFAQTGGSGFFSNNGGSINNGMYTDEPWYPLADPSAGPPPLTSTGGGITQPPGAHDRLRWITIDGVIIGPWKPFASQGNSTTDVAWKLIDPRQRYDEGGQLVGGSETNYNDYNNGGYGDAFYPPQSPNPVTLASTGITVGIEFDNPAFFGIGGAITDRNVNSHYSDLYLRAKNLLLEGMPYLSLLDFDILSIKQIVEWEKAYVIKERNVSPNVLEAYDRWLGYIDTIIDNLKRAKPGRQEMASFFLDEVRRRGIAREEPTDVQVGPDFANGSYIQEFYLRVKELPYQGMPADDITFFRESNYPTGDPLFQQGGIQGTEASAGGVNQYLASVYNQSDTQFRIDIDQAKWKNSNYVDKGGRTEFLKDIVNIEAFQTYIDSRFATDGELEPHAKWIADNAGCTPEMLTTALIQNLPIFEECGEEMAATLGVALEPDRSHFTLGDFFESIHLGVRISYVSAMEPCEPGAPISVGESTTTSDGTQGTQQNIGLYIGEDCWRYQPHDPVKLFYKEVIQKTGMAHEPFKDFHMTSDFIEPSIYEKAYYVPNGPGCLAHVVPIVCSEIPIDMSTSMRDVRQRYPYNFDFGGTGSRTFFAHQYSRNRNALRNQLLGTDEYKALFQYLFPVSRMLSLNNIYGSEYLRSYKGINELFDPTKMRLKDLFFNLYNSGNYEADCGPSNLDLQLGAMNGIPGAALAATLGLMIAKTVVLIFKGFVEAFDINIAVSKLIRDSIHLVNALIAQGQIMANQSRQLAHAAGEAADDLKNIGKSCTTDDDAMPPDDWFDPIDENFIPEPQIMYISLALLPITLLPLLWPGLPITPFGVAYWGMDWRPEPNWLSSMPPADWLDKLFNKDAGISTSPQEGLVSCPTAIDIGLPPVGEGDT